MTRLLQWLLYLSCFAGVWLGLCIHTAKTHSILYEIVLIFPVYLVIAFGCYSLMVIGFRVYKFNDCADAASELHKEIQDAQAELSQKGFHFTKLKST